jgi:peptide/nickel transport system substrate-binding protein
MRKTTLLPLVGAIAVVASLIIGPAATAGSERAAQAGTVVFIHDQEPPNLQGPWVGNNLYATSLVINNIFYAGQIYNDKGNLVPALFTGKPTITKRQPLTVQFQYKPNAIWSDGRQVTCADFRATWQMYINPQNNPISREGWDEIRSVNCAGKRGTVVFKTRYAGWEPIVSEHIRPAHILAGKNANELFLSSIPVSNGPWLFDSWQKGVQLTVRKNPRYRSGPPMKLNRVVFRYILDTNARFQALKAGQGQVMEPQPQLQIADFLRDRNFVVARKIGFAWEHIDFQFGDKGHPALKRKYVREALITGMNRTQIAQALYGTIAPGLKPVQSHIFKPFEPYYRENFGKWKFSQSKVIQTLRRNGCTGGPARPSAGNNDIYSCPGVGKLSFRFFTTSGNQLRALTFEIIQRQLKSVGIELVPRFQAAGTLFGTTLVSRDWDLIMFTYVGTPTSVITASPGIWRCGGPQNYMTYCNRAASRLMTRVETTLEARERARLWNEAESRYMANDLPSIPVYARPVFVIRRNTLKGPVVNPTNEGTAWNISAWAA